jgi:hypothetical protein
MKNLTLFILASYIAGANVDGQVNSAVDSDGLGGFNAGIYGGDGGGRNYLAAGAGGNGGSGIVIIKYKFQ